MNVFLTVVSYDPTNRVLFVKNDGLTPGAGGQIIPDGQPVYLATYNPTFATIVGNVIDGGAPGGDIGVASLSKATISGNFITGYRVGIYLYSADRNPLFPPSRGTVIDSNVILTPDPYSASWFSKGYFNYGIESYAAQDIICSNLIFAPVSFRLIGIGVHADSWVEANTVLPAEVIRQSYASTNRSVGIAFGSDSTGSTSVANRTYGLDVGIGPPAYENVPHRVISHFSTNDVLAIDPRGLTDDSMH